MAKQGRSAKPLCAVQRLILAGADPGAGLKHVPQPAMLVEQLARSEQDGAVDGVVAADLPGDLQRRGAIRKVAEMGFQPDANRGDVQHVPHRSEDRRVGKECVSTCSSRWSPYH